MASWTMVRGRLGTAWLIAAWGALLLVTAGCNSKDEEIVLPPPTGNQPLEPDVVPEDEEPTVESKVKVTASVFGKLPDGREVKKYTLDNGTMSVDIIEWGATIVAMRVPDRNGKLENVTLGFPNLEGYLQRHPYFGSTVGRYANRIAHGKFTLQGKTYQLTLNDGPHHLHGGKEGFDHKLWSSRLTEPGENFAGVSFDYTSPDGEEGYPGTLMASVVYTLTTNNELGIQFHAQTDQTTIVNLTNHAYFNLAGAGKGTILDHRLTIVGDRYLPVDDTLIPTGELASVEGTPFDFRKAYAVGERIGELKGDPGGVRPLLRADGEARRSGHPLGSETRGSRVGAHPRGAHDAARLAVLLGQLPRREAGKRRVSQAWRPVLGSPALSRFSEPQGLSVGRFGASRGLPAGHRLPVFLGRKPRIVREMNRLERC